MVSKENFNKCSLIIKRIPEWINKDTRVEVRQITEREVEGASMMGLSVFRDSIYERERRSVKKSKLKKSLKEFERRENDSSNYYSGSSSISSETDDSDDSFRSKPKYSMAARKKKGGKNATIPSNSKMERKKKYFSSSSSGSFEGFDTNLRSLKANLKKKKKISVNQRNLRRFKTLIPVLQKYETKEEMKARHEIMLREVKEKYDKVVNRIKEEEELMELQLASYEKYKKRKSGNQNATIWPLASTEGMSQYLCPLHFCSVLLSSPEQHLIEVHKEEISTQGERNIYLKALRKVAPNLNKNILNS